MELCFRIWNLKSKNQIDTKTTPGLLKISQFFCSRQSNRSGLHNKNYFNWYLWELLRDFLNFSPMDFQEFLIFRFWIWNNLLLRNLNFNNFIFYKMALFFWRSNLKGRSLNSINFALKFDEMFSNFIMFL